MATVIFLVTKFTAGAWVVVLAVPAFIALFARIHRYYQQARHILGLGSIPGKPRAEPAVVVVPVVGVSRLAQRAISEALSISAHVIAVTVLTGDTDPDTSRDLQQQWNRWNPGPPLVVLHTEYASVAGPILAFLDRLREQRTEQIVVLIPVAVPDRLRYTFLHDHVDLVLTAALRNRSDVVTARVPALVHLSDRQQDTSTRDPVPTPVARVGPKRGAPPGVKSS